MKSRNSASKNTFKSSPTSKTQFKVFKQNSSSKKIKESLPKLTPNKKIKETVKTEVKIKPKVAS